MSSKVFVVSRFIAAALLALTAAYHAVLTVATNTASLRHGTFVVINLALAALLVWRPRWAFFPALLLSAQQMWSHGLSLSGSFVGSAPLDWASLGVCLFFPTLVTVLFLERQELAERAQASGEG